MAKEGNRRNQKAASIMELPLALLILLVFGGFPFITICTLALKVAFVQLVCCEAARGAAAAPTFVQSQQGQLSAVDAANSTVKTLIARFNGISITPDANGQPAFTEVAATVLNPDANPGQPAVTYFQSQLPLPGAQTNTYLYQYKVTVHSSIDPIVRYSGKLFGKIPGWTEPFQLTLSSSAFCEHPEGLID